MGQLYLFDHGKRSRPPIIQGSDPNSWFSLSRRLSGQHLVRCEAGVRSIPVISSDSDSFYSTLIELVKTPGRKKAVTKKLKLNSKLANVVTLSLEVCLSYS